MNEFEEFEEEGDNTNYQNEAKAFERAGGYSGKLNELLSKITAVDDNLNKKEIISPEDRFLILLDALSKKFGLRENDTNEILESTLKMTHTKYKNPCGVIMGYIVLNRNSKIINQKTFDSVLEDDDNKYKEEMKKWGIEPEDIIRYARYLSGL